MRSTSRVPSIDLSTDCEKVIESTKSNRTVCSLKQNTHGERDDDSRRRIKDLSPTTIELQKKQVEKIRMKRKQEEDQKRVVKRIRKGKKKKTGKKKKNKKDLRFNRRAPYVSRVDEHGNAQNRFFEMWTSVRNVMSAPLSKGKETVPAM